MPALPSAVQVYRCTPWFDEHSVPQGLLKDHSTRAGIWGRIVVESGFLTYFMAALPPFSFVLSPKKAGIVPPERVHWVAPRGPVKFRVEFLREAHADTAYVPDEHSS